MKYNVRITERGTFARTQTFTVEAASCEDAVRIVEDEGGIDPYEADPVLTVQSRDVTCTGV